MSEERDPSTIDLPLIHEAPCRHLRSKGMYVFSDGMADPSDDYDSTIFWCMNTMKSFGPDDDMVDRYGCRNPGRTCYEPI